MWRCTRRKCFAWVCPRSKREPSRHRRRSGNCTRRWKPNRRTRRRHGRRLGGHQLRTPCLIRPGCHPGRDERRDDWPQQERLLEAVPCHDTEAGSKVRRVLPRFRRGLCVAERQADSRQDRADQSRLGRWLLSLS